MTNAREGLDLDVSPPNARVDCYRDVDRAIDAVRDDLHGALNSLLSLDNRVKGAARTGTTIGPFKAVVTGSVTGMEVGAAEGAVLGAALGFVILVGRTILWGSWGYPLLEQLGDSFVDQQMPSMRQSYRTQCDRMFGTSASGSMP